MNPREAAWLAHQRRRWMLPDPSRWLQPDQSKWVRPEAAWHPASESYDRKYSPDQPRVPAGSKEGGQWTDAGGGGSGSGEGGGGGGSSATQPSAGNRAADQSRTQVAGTIIRVCIAGSHSLTTVGGIKTYQVTYECTGGRSFIKSGFGHDFKRIVLDPFQR